MVLNSKVQSVSRRSVSVVDITGNATEIPFGACVWATGGEALKIQHLVVISWIVWGGHAENSLP